jgi:hypothetical protein
MDPGAPLKIHLEQLKALRGDAAVAPSRLQELKAFQAARLAATYADIARQPRYSLATAFFLGDLYGPKDFSRRDASMLRILPVMVRMLPEKAVQTATRAVELEAVSERLDHHVATALEPGPMTTESYARAYRAGSTRPERERQIELVMTVGRDLDGLVKKPLIASTLRLMRRPARMMGMQDLQDFLERGFAAFRAMDGGAETFLALVRERETLILNALFSGAPEPFSV